MHEKDDKMLKTPGFAWRVSLSIIVCFGWLVFLVLWLFFYAQDFNVYQNIAIFLVSILTAVAILGASWASWGIKYSHQCRCEPERKNFQKKKAKPKKNKQ